MAPYIKYALVPLFVGCSVFGAYATIGSLKHNGLGAVLRGVASGDRSSLLGAPEPFKRSYTGVAAIDGQLRILVLFFSALLDGAVPPETRLFYLWGMGQFVAGWTLVLLESLRAGNRGRAVSWIATFGLIFQNISWTVALPIWLAMHLLTSPVAKLRNGDGDAARKTLFVLLWDMALIPSSVTVGFIAPAILMPMSELLHQSAATHYNWIAIWQAFPLWNALMLQALHQALLFVVGSLELRDEKGEKTTPGKGYVTAAADVYGFALTVATFSHVPVLALSVLPPPLRKLLASFFPSYATYIERGTFANIFVPHSPSSPPSVVPTAYASGDLAPVAIQFLQYDLFVASVPFLLWALYLYQTTVKNPSLVTALKNVGYWTLIGGPHAAVAVLLRERDDTVLEGEAPLEKKKN
ncbi:hypothetical protein JX265_007591 [Neoarthrinium moseri]|uniref:Uncharacterized protein n=1 Tax=Neoarthrinium moseri TaxID=1658444 RepID=A0A9Q0AN38_9PEZI|nr:uncharacterized protein JN550_013141 [Neoarthrinium moseri]KAI1854539.1 hypothetical protein JX266_000657 [Neoarthrinium moseri]KAI1857572.1 hypothetical protein JN550_013141 [Neoarthrinium moseri]KAI1867015.1 hypothetical protein JX265_007591 [Neoarthrinium moseri]